MKSKRLILNVTAMAVVVVSGHVQAGTQLMIARDQEIVAQLNVALAKSDAKSLENVETQIQNLTPAAGVGAEESRRSSLHLLVSVLGRVHAAVKPATNAADRPAMNIAPKSSGGVVYDSGVDPKSIKDPAVRKDYEQRLAENAKKLERARFQDGLKQLESRWTVQLADFVARSYSQTVTDTREIEIALDRCVSDPKFRAHLRERLLKSRT